MQAFEWQEEEIVRQMCQVNVKGRVVASGLIDTKTRKELARFTIEFDSGASAYIPFNDNALPALRAKELPFFSLRSFGPNEDMRISMTMAEAIQLGVLDPGTVQSIQAFRLFVRIQLGRFGISSSVCLRITRGMPTHPFGGITRY